MPLSRRILRQTRSRFTSLQTHTAFKGTPDFKGDLSALEKLKDANSRENVQQGMEAAGEGGCFLAALREWYGSVSTRGAGTLKHPATGVFAEASVCALISLLCDNEGCARPGSCSGIGERHAAARMPGTVSVYTMRFVCVHLDSLSRLLQLGLQALGELSSQTNTGVIRRSAPLVPFTRALSSSATATTGYVPKSISPCCAVLARANLRHMLRFFIFILSAQLLEKPMVQAAVSQGPVLPTFGVKQQTTMLGSLLDPGSTGMLTHCTRHFFSDGS